MASSPQHEPTMEEILASIRKIISEDSTEPPKPEAAPAPQHQDAEVLELTQEVEEEPATAPRMAAPEPQPAPKPVESAAQPPHDVVFQPIQQEAAMSSSAAEVPSSEIFSDKSRKALDDVLGQLDDMPSPQPDAPRQRPSFAPAPAADGDSVEAVFERAVTNAVGPHVEQWMDGRKDEILASLRPLIREWMDEHFPPLLEGVVRDEVSRAMRARGRR